MQEQNKTLVIGCGGCGSEIVSQLEINQQLAGYSLVEKIAIDTFKQLKNPNFTYVTLPGDGAGADSKDGMRLVKAHVNTLMRDKIPNADLTVLVTSATGGSGNPLAFLLLKEMLKLDRLVVLIMVMSSESPKHIYNGATFFASIQRLAMELGKVIPLVWLENTIDEPQAKVNERALTQIRLLAILNSGLNDRLDNNDLKNWINVQNNTKDVPQLLDLITCQEQNGAITDWDESGHRAITALSLLKSDSEPQLNLGATFHTTGYLPDGLVNAKSTDFHNFHFILTNSIIPDRVAYLNSLVKHAKQIESAANALDIPLMDADNLF